MSSRPIRVGSRDSALALVQANIILKLLEDAGATTELVHIRTHGDEVTDRPLSQVGGSGLFIKEIETALLDERIDVAVHSMKDVPSKIAPDLTIAATTKRLDPTDVLVGPSTGGIAGLSRDARIATGSLRRRSQLLSARPDLKIEDLRGNVPTRLQKFRDSGWEAIVLAAAGLHRLGLLDPSYHRIPVEEMVPAVGQGALALQTRDDDNEVMSLVALANDPASETAIASERAFLETIEGGCQVPIGAYGVIEGTSIQLRGFVGSVDGARRIDRRVEGPAADGVALGHTLADEMLAAGAAAILAESSA